MKSKTYAGIGSQETPEDICYFFTNFAAYAENHGWLLRSGGANGADTAFENGVKHPINKDIFLPWGAFNGNKSMLIKPSPLAFEMASRIHPNWEACSEGTKKLHARNIHQVLGSTLNDPVRFVICWTKNAEPVGGTATALRVAGMYHVPIFNFGGPVDEGRLEEILRS